MKINYTFADGTSSDVEVSEELGTMILDLRREEHAGDERERSHRAWSMDGAEYEGIEFADPSGDPEERLSFQDEKNRSNKALKSALGKLTPTQQRRLMKIAAGKTIAEIAREESASFNSVKESVEAARKKMKKVLKKF